MSTINCPNCGRPLRPGAKFCGNCGATLPAGVNAAAGKVPAEGGNLPANAPPRPAASPPAGDMVPCPNCGKPVRRTAKFCGNCGKAIDTGAPTLMDATPPPPSATQSATLQEPVAGIQPAPLPRTSISGEQARPPAGARPVPPPPTGALPPAARPSSRRGLTLALLAVLLAVCVLAGVGGYFGARQMGWISAGGKATQTVTGVLTSTMTTSPAAPTFTATVPVSPTAVVVNALPFTPTLSGPAVTATLTPTVAALVAPTLGATEPAPVAPLATDAPPATVASPSTAEVLFEDTFDGELRDHWVTWGTPFAAIQSGFGDRYLSLRGDDPQASGVTNAAAYRVLNGPGTVIEFSGQLDPKFQNYMIFFDWDQETVTRGPGYRQPGVIHVEIRAKNVILLTPLTQGNCQSTIQEGRNHTYRIKILENQGVELYVDDNAEPICPALNMGLAPLPGKISFSGLGWVSYVKVQQGP